MTNLSERSWREGSGGPPGKVWVSSAQCWAQGRTIHDSSGVRWVPPWPAESPTEKAYTARTGKCGESAGDGKPICNHYSEGRIWQKHLWMLNLGAHFDEKQDICRVLQSPRGEKRTENMQWENQTIPWQVMEMNFTNKGHHVPQILRRTQNTYKVLWPRSTT